MCPCCDGKPVVFIGSRPSTNGYRPAEILCAKHAMQWSRIRRLEAELFDDDYTQSPESLADPDLVAIIHR